MKGHNYGLCRFCGKNHEPPRGMTNKKHSKEVIESIRQRGKERYAQGKLKNFFDSAHSLESRKKRSIKMKEWWKNGGTSPETRKSISENHLNEKNPMWKGNKVQYNALHGWVRRRKPKPKLCEECKIRKPYDLANISEEYKRDINDYEWLCRRCHMDKDGRMDNLINCSKRCKN